MMWFLVTSDQYQILLSINNQHTNKKISPRKSNNGNLIVCGDLLNDCNNPNDTWYDWKNWLLSLQPTDETPAPPPPRPSPKPNHIKYNGI